MSSGMKRTAKECLAELRDLVQQALDFDSDPDAELDAAIDAAYRAYCRHYCPPDDSLWTLRTDLVNTTP
jgi:hypothetical protein